MTETVSSEVLSYEVSNRVAWIRLDRPATRNAIDGELRTALVAATGKAAKDPEVRAVVVTGEGSAFCAGADVSSFQDVAGRPQALRDEYETLLTRLRTMPKPTLAAVRGAAAGIGVSLACCCDIRFASEDAFFRVAFVDIGLTVDGGASWLLPRLIGLGRAFEMCYTARRVGAEEAERWGLVNRVVPAEQLEDEVRELAERLARGPATALGAVKRSLTFAATSGFEEAVDFEFLLQGAQMQGPDFREGVVAFLEKRRPDFG
jgi:2-(1,2-epoxy-1,2-dihydrophenyl)acetyl-CoA isomerase